MCDNAANETLYVCVRYHIQAILLLILLPFRYPFLFFPLRTFINPLTLKCPQVDNADWSSAFRDKLFNVPPCDKWAVVFPPREEAETKQFVQSLAKTSMGLGFKLGMPKMFPIKDNKTATYIQEINKVTFVEVT